MPYKIYKDKHKKSGESKRYCSYHWFHSFKFIAYSKSEVVLFCLACVLFPMLAHQGSRAKILITHPYNDWKHGLEELKGHSICSLSQRSHGTLRKLHHHHEEYSITDLKPM